MSSLPRYDNTMENAKREEYGSEPDAKGLHPDVRVKKFEGRFVVLFDRLVICIALPLS